MLERQLVGGGRLLVIGGYAASSFRGNVYHMHKTESSNWAQESYANQAAAEGFWKWMGAV